MLKGLLIALGVAAGVGVAVVAVRALSSHPGAPGAAAPGVSTGRNTKDLIANVTHDLSALAGKLLPGIIGGGSGPATAYDSSFDDPSAYG